MAKQTQVESMSIEEEFMEPPGKRQTTLHHFLNQEKTTAMSPDSSKGPLKPTRSIIWNYFKKSEDNKGIAICQIKNCHATIQCCGNTTNCRKHLERHHPAYVSALEDGVNVVSSTSSEELETQIKKQTNKQMSIRKFVKQQKGAYTADSARKKMLDEKLWRMVIRDLQPLSIVDDEGFNEFVHALDPRYALPSRRHLRDVLIDKAYMKTHESIQRLLESVKYIAITFDGWTSRTMKHYLTITAHFIYESKLRASTLAIAPMDCRATGANMTQIITDVFANKKLLVVAAVTDNAANVKLSCEQMKITNIPCVSHTIQLVINKAIYHTEEVNDEFEILSSSNGLDNVNVAGIIKKAKHIATFFHCSTVGTLELEKELKNRCLPNLKLVQSVATRWNSTYYMLESISKMLEAIVVVLLRVDNSLEQFSSKERNYIPLILKILKPFVDASERLGGQYYATISLTIPCVKHILTELEALREDLIECPELISFILDLIRITKEKLLTYEQRRNIAGFATVLDPRFKEHGFYCSLNYMRVASELQKELRKEVSSSTNCSIPITHEETDKGKKAPEMFSFLKNVSKASTVPVHPFSQAIVHLNQYLSQPLVDTRADIIDFWHKYHGCEELKALALRYLIVPATSVPSERTNSTAGNIISDKRAALDPEFAEKLVFLKQNFEFLKLQ